MLEFLVWTFSWVLAPPSIRSLESHFYGGSVFQMHLQEKPERDKRKSLYGITIQRVW